MTDNLRDRIERIVENHALINGADECTCGVMWEVQDGFRSTDGSTCYDNHLAGAVIAALGMQRASRPNDYGYVDYPPGDRYITDWIAPND